MPAVITYWQLPEDELEFLTFLISTGEVFALSNVRTNRREDIVLAPVLEFVENYNQSDLLMSVSRDLLERDIEAAEINGRLWYGVTLMTGCAISYSRGRLNEKRLTQSNLAAYWQYMNADGSGSVKKDASFVKWGQKVMKWVRKSTSESVECNGYPYRATKRAKEAVVSGKIEAVLY